MAECLLSRSMYKGVLAVLGLAYPYVRRCPVKGRALDYEYVSVITRNCYPKVLGSTPSRFGSFLLDHRKEKQWVFAKRCYRSKFLHLNES